MDVFELRQMSDRVRVRWVYDCEYQSEGSFAYDTDAYDTDAETRQAVEKEIEALNRGDYVALGAIVESLCPTCESWNTIDSLWGIVIEPDSAKLDAFASDALDLHGAGVDTVRTKGDPHDPREDDKSWKEDKEN